jgi:HIP---CoA ligase
MTSSLGVTASSIDGAKAGTSYGTVLPQEQYSPILGPCFTCVEAQKGNRRHAERCLRSGSMSETGGQWRSIPEMIAASAQRFGDHVAIDDGQSRFSYAELHQESRSFGAALVASGIETGDRVALWAFNSAQWVVALLGLFQAGAVLVPINTRFKGREAAEILARSRARALVTVTDFLETDYVEMLQSTEIELPDLTTIVVASGRVSPGAVSWDEFMGRATDADRTRVDEVCAGLGPEDPSDILFTSGTTGTPKGVVMTHGRTLCTATDWVDMTGLCADDRYLMVNPYFHMFGLKGGILACVAGGATMLPQAVFDVDRVLARIDRDRVTVLPGPPTLYQAILDHPARGSHELTSLRVAVTGAADIPVELVRRVSDELPFSIIISGYGLTEGGTAAATSPGDDVETIASTVGRSRPGFELRVVDEHGDEVTAGVAGELLLRGSSVMKGYLDDSEATQHALSPDGWLRTGDIGLLDEAGYLRIVGRIKDMFIVGGFNAYPAEIENVLLRHPEIRQAAVIGIPDERLGEVGMAFVVTGSGTGSGPEIIRWCRDQMANYKVPRVVEIVDELPVNATGKVMKDTLREQVARGHSGVTQ